MQQEIAFFEQNRVEQLPAQIQEIFDGLQASIGEKISNLIFAASTVIASIGYSLFFGWAFALVCTLYLPFLMAIVAYFGRGVQKATLEKLDGIKKLAGSAEETLMAIKLVASYCQEDREVEQFAANADEMRKIAVNR